MVTGAPCSTGRWFSPGDRSRRSPLAFLRAAVPEARVLVGGRAVVEEGGLGGSPWRRAGVGLPDGQFRLGLHAPIAPDVGHGHAARPQNPPDQEVAVTTVRVFLAAEQGDAGRLCFGQYLVEAAAERRGRGELAVEHVALLVVELVALGPAAELAAHRDVGDPAPGQGFTERSRAEVRHVAGPGHGAHVGDGLDAVLPKEAQEVVESLVGMADREQARSVSRHVPCPQVPGGGARLRYWERPGSGWRPRSPLPSAGGTGGIRPRTGPA